MAARRTRAAANNARDWISPWWCTSAERTWFGSIRNGLSESGFVEGQNVAIEFRWAEGHYDRLSAMALDLVRRQVAVIVAFGITAALAAKAATTTIPIVFTAGGDPAQIGLVASINRPGGNLTGVNTFGGEIAAKGLGVLRQLVPGAVVIAILVNPKNLADVYPITPSFC